MPTPPKPFSVLQSEKKSHRTKREMQLREEGEKALATGVSMKERPSVKNNTLAHNEFRRINKLLKEIGKNDAIYEAVINRYCMIQAECTDLEMRREKLYHMTVQLQELFEATLDELIGIDKMELIMKFTSEIGTINTAMLNIDKTLQTKRKMLLDIEKENVMTIVSALRSIPKKEESKVNPLLQVLGNDT